MTDLPPIVLGAAGLMGRQEIVRVPDMEQPIEYDETGEPVFAQPPAEGMTIPSNCLRVLNSPLTVERGGGCNCYCQGRLDDGTCLAEVARAANEQGIAWEFSVEIDQYGEQHWAYTGPPLAPS